MTIKLKTTKKDIKNNACKILKIHYCKAQTLLWYEYPFAYSAGNMGWACDYYNIDNIRVNIFLGSDEEDE